MRNSTMTGVCEASDSSNPFSISSTTRGWWGRGSISQAEHFMAKAWVRSWMMLAPSP